jgi:hypothetical protein
MRSVDPTETHAVETTNPATAIQSDSGRVAVCQERAGTTCSWMNTTAGPANKPSGLGWIVPCVEPPCQKRWRLDTECDATRLVERRVAVQVRTAITNRGVLIAQSDIGHEEQHPGGAVQCHQDDRGFRNAPMRFPERPDQEAAPCSTDRAASRALRDGPQGCVDLRAGTAQSSPARGDHRDASSEDPLSVVAYFRG